jgi:hypothetical protein
MPTPLLYNKPKPKLPAYASKSVAGMRPLDEIAAPTPMLGVVSRPGALISETAAAPQQMTSSYAQPLLGTRSPGGGIEKLSAGLSAVAPFATNIANMFTKPPLPPAPSYMSPVSLKRSNLDGDRARVDQELRGADLAADRLLDGNNAVAARIGGFSQRVKAFTDVNQRERNENTEIANRETQINSRIQERNLGAQDQFGRDKVERDVAISSARSANLADMADKYVDGRNQDSLRQLDKNKLKVLSKMSPDVWKRFMSKLKKDGFDPEA